MAPVRRLLAQRHLAALLCAATLVLRLLVPAGYMVDSVGGHLAITQCSGIAGQPMTMAMPGMSDASPGHGTASDHGRPGDHGKAEMPCPFSGLSAPALDAVDPVLLAAPAAFVMAAGLSAAVRPVVPRRGYLRPPLRGPPLLP